MSGVTQAQFNELRKENREMLTSMGDLAVIVKDMAEHVYSEEEELDKGRVSYEDPLAVDDPLLSEEEKMGGMHRKQEEEYPMLEDVPVEEEITVEEEFDKGSHMRRGEEEIIEEDEYMELTPAMKAAYRLGMRRGYANTARTRSDEEDSPFGEQQDSISGNAPQPAGDNSGNREDETFNAKFAVSRVEGGLASLRKEFQTMRRARAITPPMGMQNKGRQVGGGGPQVVTREMQEQVKSRSYAEINQLRTMTGDLPSHGQI